MKSPWFFAFSSFDVAMHVHESLEVFVERRSPISAGGNRNYDDDTCVQPSKASLPTNVCPFYNLLRSTSRALKTFLGLLIQH